MNNFSLQKWWLCRNNVTFAMRSYHRNTHIGKWNWVLPMFRNDIAVTASRYPALIRPHQYSTDTDNMDFNTDNYWYLRHFNYQMNDSNFDFDEDDNDTSDEDRSMMQPLGSLSCNVSVSKM